MWNCREQGLDFERKLAEELDIKPNERHLRVAGLGFVRQRPATARGITFVTLEDETGTRNLII